MIKILKQFDAGDNTLLILDSPLPQFLFKKIIIDRREYEPVVVYDLDNSIGIVGHGIFEGETIEFI